VKNALTLLGVVLSVAVWGPAEALWINLRPEQISQAIAYGRTGKDIPSETFEREWRVTATEGRGTVTVDSEFLIVARTARELARRGNPDDVNLPEAMCAFLAGPALYVAVTVEVRAGEEQVPIDARLEMETRAVAPLDIWPWQLVARERAQGAARGVRVSHYLKFPLDGLDLRSRVTLVASGPEGRTWRFPLDLGSMR